MLACLVNKEELVCHQITWDIAPGILARTRFARPREAGLGVHSPPSVRRTTGAQVKLSKPGSCDNRRRIERVALPDLQPGDNGRRLSVLNGPIADHS